MELREIRCRVMWGPSLLRATWITINLIAIVPCCTLEVGGTTTVIYRTLMESTRKVQRRNTQYLCAGTRSKGSIIHSNHHASWCVFKSTYKENAFASSHQSTFLHSELF